MKMKKTIMKTLRVLLFSMLLLLEACSAGAFPRMYREPSSIADSKKMNTLRGIVIAEPDHFCWEGHDVVVSEAWLDKYYTGSVFLLFKLNIDGKSMKESSIESKERKFLNFDRADGAKPILFFYNLSRGLFGQQRIYFLELPAQQPKQVKLNVNTGTTVNRKPVTKNTGITITFHIPASGDQQTDTGRFSPPDVPPNK